MKMSKNDYIKPNKIFFDKEWVMSNIYEMQEEFFEKGEFALGCIVAANNKLFKRGLLDLPGYIIYTFDGYYEENVEEFEELANEVYDIGGTRQEDKSLKKIAYLLEDMMENDFGIRLPLEMTGGREVFFSSIMFNRKYLPGKKLPGRVYPLHILRGKKPDAMLIPHWYW